MEPWDMANYTGDKMKLKDTVKGLQGNSALRRAFAMLWLWHMVSERLVQTEWEEKWEGKYETGISDCYPRKSRRIDIY